MVLKSCTLTFLLQEELEELSRAETKSKVANFLSTEKSIVSRPHNPFIGESSKGIMDISHTVSTPL